MRKAAAPRKRDTPKLVDTHYRLPEPLYRKLRAKAYKQGRRQAEVVVEALDLYFQGEA